MLLQLQVLHKLQHIFYKPQHTPYKKHDVKRVLHTQLKEVSH